MQQCYNNRPAQRLEKAWKKGLESMADIFVLGSFVVGMTIRIPRPPVAGESLIGDSFDIGAGGKGTNQAVAAARLGAAVNLLACVGDDLFASIALALYQQEGISTQHIHQIPNANSGIGFVNLFPSGENWITVDLGANRHLNAAHVRAAEPQIARSTTLMTTCEAPPDALDEALRLGRRHGARILLNPAPARRIPRDVLAQVDILTPNESEARILLGLAPDDPTPTRELAHRLAALGVQQVIITRGKAGALIAAPNAPVAVPSPVITAADVTGAGDSFNAALAVGLGAGLTLTQAVQRACYAGAYTAQRLGVIDGLPTADELDRFIQSHPL